MNIKTALEMETWDRAIEHQYLHAGFCGYCGEAVAPFVKDFPQELIDTACEYNGEHPDCGDHDMQFVEKLPETFGAYEIWKCLECGIQTSY